VARGRDFESLRQASTLHGVTKVPQVRHRPHAESRTYSPVSNPANSRPRVRSSIVRSDLCGERAICANHSSSTSDPTRSKVTATVTATRSVSPRCTRLLSLTRRSPSCTRSQHVVADAEICHDAAPSPSAGIDARRRRALRAGAAARLADHLAILSRPTCQAQRGHAAWRGGEERRSAPPLHM